MSIKPSRIGIYAKPSSLKQDCLASLVGIIRFSFVRKERQI